MAEKKQYLTYKQNTQWGAYVKEVAGANTFKEYEKNRLRLTRYYDKLYGKGKYDYSRMKYEAANITLYGTEMRTEQARLRSRGVTDPQKLKNIAVEVRLEGLLKKADETGVRLDVTQLHTKDGEKVVLEDVTLRDILAYYERGEIDEHQLDLLIDDFKTFALEANGYGSD